jgi:hypothetical protein
MLRDPRTHRYTLFAGQRVRVAEAVVELIERKPARVVPMTFDILTFDREGSFDTEAFDRHQFSRFVGAMSASSGSAAAPPRQHRASWTPAICLLLEEVGGRPQGRCWVPCTMSCWTAWSVRSYERLGTSVPPRYWRTDKPDANGSRRADLRPGPQAIGGFGMLGGAETATSPSIPTDPFISSASWAFNESDNFDTCDPKINEQQICSCVC